MDFAVREADYLKADSLSRRLPPPHTDTLLYQTLQAFKENDVAEQEALYRALEEDTAAGAAFLSYRLIHNLQNPEAAARFADLAVKEKGSKLQATQAATIKAYVDAERGQVRAAVARLMAADLPEKRAPYTAFVAFPLYRVPADQLAAMRQEIERMDSVPKSDALNEQVRPHVRLYRLALFSCRAGDYAAANAYAQRIRTMPAPAVYQPSLMRAADEIDAQVDVENGRYDQAIKRLSAHRTMVPTDIGGGFVWGAVAPVWLAEALYQSGRYEEAQKRFDNLDDAIYSYGPHLSYILLRRAQIADARNDADTARDLYARVLKFWTQPDPELKPVVDQARARLAALQRQDG